MIIRLIGLLAIAIIAGGVWAWAEFRADMRSARAAVDRYETRVVDTSFGPVEFVDTGDETASPVLSIHGTGGGFDQGLILAEGLRAEGYRIIAPSRFGYLGTNVPARADALAQAEAFAETLDQMAVEDVIVMGTSAGAITALAFAARYPERTAALLLMVPAYYPSEQAPPEPWSPLQTWIVTRVLRSDFLFWASLKLAPTATAAAILATDRALIEQADAVERARIDAFLWTILPISERADGLMLDALNTASPPSIDLGAIIAPTFVAAAEDDHYRTADSARLIAERVRGTVAFITPDGGHAWVNREEEVARAVRRFLLEELPDRWQSGRANAVSLGPHQSL